MARRAGGVGVLVALLAVAGAASWMSRASAQSLSPSVVERLRAATVFIGIYDLRSDRLRASGSGFLVSRNGEVVTARHVAQEPGRLRVFLNSGQPDERRLDATVTRLDRYSDLALLKVDRAETAFLDIGDSGRLRETDPVATVSFPLGMELSTGALGPGPSFRTGAVTSLRRTRYGGLVWVEMTNGGETGSSGGPVIDERGSVLGVVVQGGGRSTVLAVPSRRLVTFASERISLAEGDAPSLRAWLGDPVEQAQVLVESGQFPKARDALRPALERDPHSARLLDLSVGIQEGLGELDACIAAYERLLRDHRQDGRAAYWSARLRQLVGYRGDSNPRNNLVICAPQRQEVILADAGAGRVLETLRGLRLMPYAAHRADGRYAYTRGRTALVAADLVLPQEASHLRRDRPELGTTDWISASRDGSVVALGISPEIQPTPRGSVVVFRGPDLDEAHSFNFTDFFPGGYLTPDGRFAYVVSVARMVAGGPPIARVQRLDLSNGRLIPFLAETPFLSWLAFPADLPVAYGLQPDRQVVRIDLNTGRVTPSGARDVFDISAAPDPGQVLLGNQNLVVWDAAKDRAVHRYALPFVAYEVGATPDAVYYYAASERRDRLAIVNRATGQLTEMPLERPAGPVETGAGARQ